MGRVGEEQTRALDGLAFPSTLIQTFQTGLIDFVKGYSTGCYVLLDVIKQGLVGKKFNTLIKIHQADFFQQNFSWVHVPGEL